uniref:Uncharacterized protein n=1 Tax=Phytophthora ramorum TaxID=164328 RepID=H3GPB5_PHYRM
MEAVTKAMENVIGVETPESFGFVIDGWSHGTEHYLAVYACYETEAGPQFPLLSLAPVMDEPDDQLNAEGHLTAMKRILPFFFVGDNCAVNKRLANLLGVPLVGYTRWLSTRSMIKRYFRLREFVSADNEELEEDYLPSRTVHRKLEALQTSLPSDADIVHSIVFEEAVVTVLVGLTPLLTEDEVAALESFKRERSSILVSDVPPSTKEELAERILKRRKVAAQPSIYMLQGRYLQPPIWWSASLAWLVPVCAMSTIACLS